MNKIAQCLALASVSVILNSETKAQTHYETPTLVAESGTSWQSTGTTSLIIDFGPARGLGTVTITSLNGGGFQSNGNPVSLEAMALAGWGYPVLETTMSNGDTLSLSSGIVFSPLNNGSTTPGESGFAITFRLNSGVFAAGDIFAAGSLDSAGNATGRSTYFQAGDAFLGLDNVLTAAPTDGAAPLQIVTGSETLLNGPLYTANGGTARGTSDFGFFRLAEDINSFTTYFTSIGSPQGVVFTLATPDAVVVPEPGSALLIGTLGVMLIFRRRR